MASVTPPEKKAHKTISIGPRLDDAATKRAAELGLHGGFSEYVERLLVADLTKCKGRKVLHSARHLPATF